MKYYIIPAIALVGSIICVLTHHSTASVVFFITFLLTIPIYES